MTMVGFLDGINDSLVIPNPIEEMEEDTVVTLAYDKEPVSYTHLFWSGESGNSDSYAELLGLCKGK